MTEGGGVTQHGQPRQCLWKLLPRILEEAANVMEPQSTPRSTGGLLVSAAAEADYSTVSHALLAKQVLLLATFPSENRVVLPLLTWHEQLELISGLFVGDDRK